MIYFSLRGVRTGVLDVGYRGTVRGPRAVVLGWICAVFVLAPLIGGFVLVANGIWLIRS